MPEITLYIQPSFQVSGKARCFSGTPFAIKVQRILEWKRLHYRVREVGWIERTELLKTLSTANKLPILEYDARLIEDSTEIAYFIDERHPSPSIIPRDPQLAARCHFLEEWADEVLYWYGIYSQRRITPVDVASDAYFRDLPEDIRARTVEALARGVEKNLYRHGIGRYPKDKVMRDIRRGLDALATFIAADGFAAGAEPSLADFALFGQFHRRLAGTDSWLEAEVAMRPVLSKWIERVDALTAPGDSQDARRSRERPASLDSLGADSFDSAITRES